MFDTIAGSNPLAGPPAADREDGRLRDLVPAAGMLVAGLLALLVAFLFSAEDRGQYVVVASPWATPGETVRKITAAGGGLMDMGGFSNIVLAASTDPDFAPAMRADGAWLVIPLPRLTGCFTSNDEAAR